MNFQLDHVVFVIFSGRDGDEKIYEYVAIMRLHGS